MAVTIKDIARRAGVSHSTVSRALHNHPALSSETVAAIQRISQEMGYAPSAVARGLKTHRSRVIGAILSAIDDPYFSEVLQGIEEGLRASENSLFVAASQGDLEVEKTAVSTLVEHRVDGVIICSSLFSREQGRRLEEFNVPIIVVNNQSAETYRYSIFHDDVYGSIQAARHLISLGHKRIGYLGNAAAGRTAKDRMDGFRQATAEAGLEMPDDLVYWAAGGRSENGVDGAEHFLKLAEPPTAIACFNDLLAVGLVSRLVSAGYHIPQDISVVGFDNIAISAFLTPPLTTFDQPKYHIGAEAARMMLRLLDSPASSSTEPQMVVLRGSLLVRQSTAPPAR